MRIIDNSFPCVTFAYFYRIHIYILTAAKPTRELSGVLNCDFKLKCGTLTGMVARRMALF